MPVDRILASVGPGETRVALLDHDDMVGLLVDRDDGAGAAGSIYFGRVARVLPGLAAAFVDIGGSRHGFLPLRRHDEAERDPADPLVEGDSVLVQVRQEAFADKGPKLTVAPSLPGRFTVLTPGRPGIRFSRRIEDAAERDRLEDVVASRLADDEGAILRTSASGVGPSRLVRDLTWLQESWRAVARAARKARPPAPVHGAPDALVRALRDETAAGVREVLIDDPAALARARAYGEAAAPELLESLRHHGGPEDLFAAHGIDAAIEAALEPLVPLPSGGQLAIEATRALVAIDVDSGRHAEGGRERTALMVNLEAADAVAAQLRLRNLSGLVLVDMLPMRDRRHGAEVLEALSAAVAPDPTPVAVAGYTRMGLIEMTRERRSPSLGEMLLAPAAATPVLSPATAAFAALRAAVHEARRSPGARLTLAAAAPVLAALEAGPARGARAQVEADLGLLLALAPLDGGGADGFEVTAG